MDLPKPAGLLQSAFPLRRRDDTGIVYRQEISWRRHRPHCCAPHLGAESQLSPTHSLHCSGRRPYQAGQMATVPKKVLSACEGVVHKISRQVFGAA